MLCLLVQIIALQQTRETHDDIKSILVIFFVELFDWSLIEYARPTVYGRDMEYLVYFVDQTIRQIYGERVWCEPGRNNLLYVKVVTV